MKETSPTELAASAMEDVAREKLQELFKVNQCHPIIVRLAWHDAGTYCAKTKTGGPNASIRYDPESAHPANAGLKTAIELLESIKTHVPKMSYADLYQLASVVAVESAGGPTIPFRLGRVDATEPECTDDGRLPDATKKMDHLRDVFYRMGFADKEITVLSGAHCLGRAHKDRSGFEGAWTKEPLVFDHSYFVELLANDQDDSLLKLASDKALLEQEETKSLCEAYANDKALFFADYAIAHKTLSELGAFT